VVTANGFYGVGCDKKCPNCKDGACDVNGKCTTGCIAKKWGAFADNKWDCDKSCSVGCPSELCDAKTGKCTTTPCVTNWVGDNCDVEVCADPTKWGGSCATDCPAGCTDKKCKKGNGDCLACPDGLWGLSEATGCTTACNA